MDIRVIGLVVGLLVAGVPARAQVSNFPTPPQPAAKPTRSATQSKTDAIDTDRTGTLARRKGKPGVDRMRMTAARTTLAALPDAERRAIQSDLAWLGDYDDGAPGDVDDRTIEAIKAFQKRHGGAATGVLDAPERARLAAAASAPQMAVGWRLVEDTATGVLLGLPEKLLPNAARVRTGSRWSSGRNQILVETFRLPEAGLSARFAEEKTMRRRRVAFAVLKPDSFIVSGEQALKKFLVRVEARGTELRGITILYDEATQGVMDRIAIAMLNAFQGFPDPNAIAQAEIRRSVEYGTAIVVSQNGDLVTLGRLTAQCRTITVPGFGHAERVAADDAGDLALLHLYGARTLTAAALAGDGGKADDLTLFGIVDPSAQAGAAAVISIGARLNGQNVEPAPGLGFAGAAAADAQGRLIGIVELKAATATNNNAAGAQAILIPVDAVRAFLQAHGIGPAAGPTATDRSVVRVICVRK